MRSHDASGRRVLPGLLLAALLLAGVITTLSPAGTPSAAPASAHRQPSGPAAAFGLPAPYDEATVHGGTGNGGQPQLHQLPVTTVADPHRAPAPRMAGTGTGTGRAAGCGADTISTCHGRAPPAAAR